MNGQDARPFDCLVVATIQKSFVPVLTKDYEESIYRDEDGICRGEYNTDFVNWEREYADSGLTPLDLFALLQKMCQEEIDTHPDAQRVKELQRIISACKGWEVEELIVEPE